MSARLKDLYTGSIAPDLREKFGYANVMQIPCLEKVVLNMGVGEATQDPRLIEAAMAELTLISGQKPSVRSARKAISNFKLRAGVKIGCMVTLRGERMYEFIDRLVNIALPRIRDFRGISGKGFDAFGNYTLGLREQTMFPEIDIDGVTKPRGMNVTFVLKHAAPVEASRELLRQFGMPFAS